MTAPRSAVPPRVLSPPRSSPSAAAADAAAARRARRDQLRDFYGLPAAGPAGASAGASTSAGGSGRSSAGANTPPASALMSPDPASARTGLFPPTGGIGGGANTSASPGSVSPNTPRSGTSPGPGTPHTRGVRLGISTAPAAARADGAADALVRHRDITSADFVPAEYYEDLIARAGLAELLVTTADLATDVGRLQSARHTLVYNHHHQLFAAGDTIAQLNTRTPQLLSIVTSLQERFSDMSQLADSVALSGPGPAEHGPGGERCKGDAAENGGVLAQAGSELERVRLMVLADEPKDKIRETWGKTEARLLSATSTPALEALLAEGRKLAGEAAGA